MKKNILLAILIIITVTVFTTGCKRVTLDNTWVLLEGSGTYSSTNNTSAIIMRSRVQINQPDIASNTLSASIVDWQLTFKQGTTDVLIIQKNNYKTILGNNLSIDDSGLEENFLWLNIESLIPISGDIFKGATPDTIDLQLYIVDSKGNASLIQNAVPFQFTRN